MIVIDGAHGEGGGQVLRTSLTLSMLTQTAVEIQHIRAGRPKPGLAAQHLTAVRAAQAICSASVSGDEIGSQWLRFRPGSSPRGGEYAFDVAQAREAGSAGAISLVLQTVLVPLALATNPSHLVLRGGTHVPWSPSFHYLTDIYLPALSRLGIDAKLELGQWGFYPAGGGEVKAHITGGATSLHPLTMTECGKAHRIWGTAVASNLPSHIPQRMANRARSLLSQAGLKADVEAQRVRSAGPGAAIFLATEDENGARAGFSAYGRKGLPAEQVAEVAVQDLLRHRQREAPVDMHLADQLICPLALAPRPSTFTTCRITEHLRTNMWVVEQFAQARFSLGETNVTVVPAVRKTP
jgi:RNA 3'-terminal phosphate cyclase (ATP)